MKFLTKSIAIATLAIAGVTAASAQITDDDGDGYFRYCDAGACYTYWNTGSPEDPNWVLISTEPRRPGDRNEN